MPFSLDLPIPYPTGAWNQAWGHRPGVTLAIRLRQENHRSKAGQCRETLSRKEDEGCRSVVQCLSTMGPISGNAK